MNVSVCVNSLAGELVAKFPVRRGSAVGSIRCLVHAAAGIPKAEQRLLWRGQLLEDDRIVKDFVDDGSATVILTLIRSSHLWALSGSVDGVLRLWDLDGDTDAMEMIGYTPVQCIAVDWKVRMAISGGSDTALQVWDLERGVCIRELAGQRSTRCIVMNWAMNLALSGSSDSTLTLWDLSIGKAVRELLGHVGGVSCVDADWSEQRAVSCSGDGVLQFWSLATGSRLKTLQVCNSMRDMAVDWLVGRILIGGGRALQLVNMCTGELQLDLQSIRVPVQRLAMDWPERHGLGAGGDGEGITISIWHLETGDCLREVHRDHGPAQCLALNTARHRLVSSGGGEDWGIKIMELETGTCVHVADGHSDYVTCAAMS